MIDMSKLTPLPQRLQTDGDMPCIVGQDGWPVMFSEDDNIADLEFWLLARSAQDVKQRRGWFARLNRYDRYLVYDRNGAWVADLQWMEDQNWTDDLTAIVEADKWMKEQESTV